MSGKDTDSVYVKGVLQKKRWEASSTHFGWFERTGVHRREAFLTRQQGNLQIVFGSRG